MSLPRYPRFALVLLCVAALLAIVSIAAAVSERGLTIRLGARGVTITSARPAPAIEQDMEREIKAASDTVRDFSRRRPLPY